MHDPDIYPDPFVFDPNRHIGENPQPNPLKFAFGFGRRVCPGQHFAEVTLFLNMASILAVFDLRKVEGNEPIVEWTNVVVS